MPDQTILIIDFDPKSIESALRSLTGAGYRVEVANDGLAGLEAYNKLHPDLVLIEPMVPRKHGFEVCKEIKASAGGPETPVLITTGFYTGRKHDSQARQLYGCDDYLEKPVSGEMLLSTCRRFLEEPETVADSIPTDEEIDAAVWEVEPEAAPVDTTPAMPSLDDLTEEEIVAHLDALIVEQPGQPPVEQEAEALVEAAEPEPAQGGMSRMMRLMLAAAGVIALIAAGAFVSLRMMEGGEALPAPVAPTSEKIPVLTGEPAAKPEATITEEIAPSESAAPKIESLPLPAQEPVVERREPPPPVAASKPKLRMEELPIAEFTDLEPAPELIAESEPAALQELPVVELKQAAVAPPKPKAAFGELFDIAEVDSPPVPVKKRPPAYNPVARKLRHEGIILLRLLINEHGQVEQVEVLSSNAGSILEKTAVDEAKGWIYRPAEKDGVAVKVWILERVAFKL